jgi:hypothetical protein
MSEMTTSKPLGLLARVIFLTGIIAGTLDAAAAIIVYQANPASMFKFIASGAFGKAAFTSGDRMIWVGVLFHFFIALSWTVFYFLVYPVFKLNRINTIVLIILFGVLIWTIMNLIVLPLTMIPQRPIELIGALKGALILIVAVALPIVIAAHRLDKSTR